MDQLHFKSKNLFGREKKKIKVSVQFSAQEVVSDFEKSLCSSAIAKKKISLNVSSQRFPVKSSKLNLFRCNSQFQRLEFQLHNFLFC